MVVRGPSEWGRLITEELPPPFADAYFGESRPDRSWALEQ